MGTGSVAEAGTSVAEAGTSVMRRLSCDTKSVIFFP